MTGLTLALCSAVVAVLLPDVVNGHGYMLLPPGRSTAWRYEKYTGYFRRNYNDMELFCGGFQNQFDANSGLCGVCGDNYLQKRPRDNERGGYYAKENNIVEQYRSGGIIDVAVNLTANHRGSFVFDICPENDASVLETESCFVVLNNADTGLPYTSLPNSDSGMVNVKLRIPKTMTCKACVLRWKYITGNSWGCGPYSGLRGCCTGCGGIQEHFYSCADIMITRSGKEKVPKWKKVDLTLTTIKRPPLPTMYPPPPTYQTTTRRPTRRPPIKPPREEPLVCRQLCAKYCKPGLSTFCLESLCSKCRIYSRFVNRAIILD